jgi:hypothetical protein
MEKDNVILSFKGMVTSELLDSVLQIMESKMEHIEESRKVRKKVYNILVECLQNLHHHIVVESEGQKNDLTTKSALLMVARTEDYYEIKTGNYILNSQVESLKVKLELINSMTKEELKLYYQYVLQEGSLSEKGTAGLGMIDIARKSGNKLNFEFLEVDSVNSFFCLNVKID